jgi:hypothetical protein
MDTKSIFTDPNAHPLTLYRLCSKTFEEDWEHWLSETIHSEVKRIFNTPISQTNFNKLQAIKALKTLEHDAFWEEWEIFQNVILALNGLNPSIYTMHAPNIAELMHGVEISAFVDKHTFNEEIARYTAVCFLFEDVHYAPPPLDYCQIYISQPMYTCHDCGKKSSALPPFNLVCESCSGTYTTPKALNFKPKIEDKGHNLSFNLTYDPTSVKKAYERLVREKEPYINEVPEEVQAAKLITAHDYCLLKFSQLQEQLTQLNL